MSRNWKFNAPRTGGGNRDQILDNLDREIRRLNDSLAGGGAGATELTLAAVLADTTAALALLGTIDTDTSNLAAMLTALQSLVAADPVLTPITVAAGIETISLDNVTAVGITGTGVTDAVGAVVIVEGSDIRISHATAPTTTVGGLLPERSIINLGAMGDSESAELDTFQAISTEAAGSTLTVMYYKLA